MILSRNRLKRLKKTIEDEDMLNYLKYSHLDFFNEPTRKTGIELRDQATQFPETRNQSTQTIDRPEKGVDTYDDLNPMSGEYILQTDDKNFNNNEKMVQATSVKVNQMNDSPPDSGDSNDEGFVSKNVRRGFRLAEFALNTAIVGTNIAAELWNATAPTEYDINAEVDEEEEEDLPTTNEEPSSSTNVPVHRDRSRSRDDEDSETNMENRLLQRGASRSRSITPSSGTASSAKTTPRKKSK